MGSVLNKLRAIEEDIGDTTHHDPEMAGAGKEIDNNSFSRTMTRLAAIKDAVGEEHYNDLRAGVRAMYMNHRPNLKQMTALMDLLETVLSYVAEDTTLFQRLKSDLTKDVQAGTIDDGSGSNWPMATPKTTKAPEIGAPATATPVPDSGMRDMKTA
jgi:hypothetical protein